ncbi:patatin-like phospholipase family protein [Stieleria varia]|uniref:Patatin-like phospholipase n=1 Tax=Stieleria varia TaxID=2528005 RepID=A0A5C6AZ80_9BACT|nr:patatin-like phospholipase family protein [Stieleria varia]TWU04296.1 Patatin-like phospholipase [Stieleria varia]
MTDGQDQKIDFETVRKNEIAEIAKRRREANVYADKNSPTESHAPESDLVGLALSGGGVRSASFNLGFIQSLYENGVLRHIDYMATVSGGGYVGSSLSSLALHPDTEFDWKSDAFDADADADASDSTHQPERKFPLSPRGDGRQPPRVLELIHGGQYLRKPLIFLNRYLVGVLLTNVVALSFVFALAALAAWMFRCLDYTWSINWLYALGFQGDIARAFFPMTLFFGLWLVMWGISYWRRGAQAEGAFARWFMTLTIASLLLAGATLLGTGDVSLTHLRDNYGIEPPSDAVRFLGGELKTYFIIGLVIALIPYLRIKDLIRSGTRPRTAVEGWVFGIASRALLYGIPLLVFGWLARENISHFNENRVVHRYGQTIDTQYDFVPLEFQNWSKTWQEIELQATQLSTSEENGRFAVSRRLWNSVDHEQVAKSIEVLEKISKYDRETSMFRRWLLFTGYTITRQPNAVTDQFVRREAYLHLRTEICQQLTQSVLVDPQFYKEFASAEEALKIELANLTDQQREMRLNNIEALSVEAQHLEKKVENVSDGELTFANWVSLRNETLRLLDRATENEITESTVQLKQQLDSLMNLQDGKFASLEVEVKNINWQLMLNYWGDRFAPKSTVFAMVCLPADQATRWTWFMWSFGLFLLSACVVNMNSTSLHGFYRNMLSKMWITDCPGIGRAIPLARLETAARGAPYHIIAATVHLLGRRRSTDRSTTDSFIFSQCYCGSNRTGYVRTESYMQGRFDLSNAMALSGAAVSPTQVHNPLLAVLLMVSNSRLGQWLPNPGHKALVKGLFYRIVSWLPPVPIRLIVGAMQDAENRNYCFVSDGGHHENLALEPLLLRRCRLIIASDVTGDITYEFRDFIRLIRRMRFEHGIRIVDVDGLDCDLGLAALTPKRLHADSEVSELGLEKLSSRLSKTNLAQSHYFVLRILYPADGPTGSPQEGFLIYVKPNFTGDEAADLTRYQLENPAFPHDPTSDQFYDPQKFESYRQLGYHIGKTLHAEQFKDPAGGRKCRPLRKWSPSDGSTPGEQSQQCESPRDSHSDVRKPKASNDRPDDAASTTNTESKRPPR